MMFLQLCEIEHTEEIAATEAAKLLRALDTEGLYLVVEAFAHGWLPSGPVEDANMKLAMPLAVPTLLAEIFRRLAAIEAN
jgi:hypothetical protein